MATERIVIKDLTFAELCLFEVYADKRAHPHIPARETELQVEKRFAEQDAWREILKRVRKELNRRTAEVV
jgi:hypothetical protein